MFYKLFTTAILAILVIAPQAMAQEVACTTPAVSTVPRARPAASFIPIPLPPPATAAASAPC
ncbi:hypothetical protein B0H19DRAFT_1160440, partial [Mycena capillaripes]